MKRIMAGIFFVMMVSGANAENIFNFYWNFGNIGFGVNYSSEDDDNIELTVSLINVDVILALMGVAYSTVR